MAKGTGKGAKGASKRIIVGVNFFFVICGIIVLVGGIVATSKTHDFRQNADIFRKTNINAGATTILVCGAVTLFAAIIGFVGVVKANLVVLKGYIVLMGVTVAMQVAIGSFTLTRDPDNALHSYWFDYTQPTDAAAKNAYQNYLSCCGWEELRDSFGPGMPLCDLKCYQNPGSCPACLPATKTWVKKFVNPGVMPAIICGVLEIIAMSASCYIILIMKKDKDDFFDDPFHY